MPAQKKLQKLQKFRGSKFKNVQNVLIFVGTKYIRFFTVDKIICQIYFQSNILVKNISVKNGLVTNICSNFTPHRLCLNNYRKRSENCHTFGFRVSHFQ